MAKNRIRALRKLAGYSQKEIGSILGVGQTTVSAWETGRNEPDNESAAKMAELLICSIGYLMGYEKESKYRGLSQEDWITAWDKRNKEQEMEELSREASEEDPEIQEYIKQAEEDEEEMAWEQGSREIFPETHKIETILERTDKAGRQRAVQILELAFPPSD